MDRRVVLITGSNQGLGFEIVKKLAAENADYRVILCSRNLAKGQEAASQVTNLAKNTKVDVLQLDVTSDDSIEAAAKLVEERYSKLDVLFNNAGVAYVDSKSVREEMHKLFDVNVASVVAVTNAFIPLLKKSKHPRIGIMSSDLGSIANTVDETYIYHSIQSFSYKASKAAVNMVGAIYSQKYKGEINVNLVNPGFRATNLNNHSASAGKKEDGAIESCRIITLGASPETATFTETEGDVPW